MKRHRVIIDTTNDFLAFWSGHCPHIEAISLITLSSPTLSIKIVVVRIEEDIISQKMIKWGSKKDMTDFL